jgi:hypothetical protein
MSSEQHKPSPCSAWVDGDKIISSQTWGSQESVKCIIQTVQESWDLQLQGYIVQIVAFFVSVWEKEKGLWECAFWQQEVNFYYTKINSWIDNVTFYIEHFYYYILKAKRNLQRETTRTSTAVNLCMWEQIETSHSRVYVTYRGRQHVKKQGSIPCIEDGAAALSSLSTLTSDDRYHIGEITLQASEPSILISIVPSVFVPRYL